MVVFDFDWPIVYDIEFEKLMDVKEQGITISERQKLLEELWESFPEPEVLAEGLFSNQELLDIFRGNRGRMYLPDLVKIFKPNLEQDAFSFRFVLSELADVILASHCISQDQKYKKVWETQQQARESERGQMYSEMGEGQEAYVDGLYGAVVLYLAREENLLNFGGFSALEPIFPEGVVLEI